MTIVLIKVSLYHSDTHKMSSYKAFKTQIHSGNWEAFFFLNSYSPPQRLNRHLNRKVTIYMWFFFYVKQAHKIISAPYSGATCTKYEVHPPFTWQGFQTLITSNPKKTFDHQRKQCGLCTQWGGPINNWMQASPLQLSCLQAKASHTPLS